MTNFFKKPKKTYFGVILGNFCPNLGKMNFPGKKALTVFKYSNYLPWWKKSEKTNSTFLIKTSNGTRQTGREPWFYSNLHRTGIQKIKFGK